jgi:hypothetical protein
MLVTPVDPNFSPLEPNVCIRSRSSNLSIFDNFPLENAQNRDGRYLLPQNERQVRLLLHGAILVSIRKTAATLTHPPLLFSPFNFTKQPHPK